MISSSAADGGRPNLLSDALVLDAWRAYFETGQQVVNRMESELKEDTGLNLGDYNLLLLLVEAPARTLRMSELADGLVFSAPRLNYRVGVLEERGWVVKAPCAEDRRAHNVTLTDEGWQEFRRAGALHRRHIEKYFDAALEPGDAEHVLRISRALQERLRRG